ncbi:hypothetical protein CEXT_79111 [Caerostris extrusa]|uniref:Transmembrane protein n=1 Tax=Caerostris extrusa TaxID=172846 RepID=A0AAV4PQS1_CAEEX|nr:hypothetical protein CEXT_79111 [Caerostris extrusa]
MELSPPLDSNRTEIQRASIFRDFFFFLPLLSQSPFLQFFFSPVLCALFSSHVLASSSSSQPTILFLTYNTFFFFAAVVVVFLYVSVITCGSRYTGRRGNGNKGPHWGGCYCFLNNVSTVKKSTDNKQRTRIKEIDREEDRMKNKQRNIN